MIRIEIRAVIELPCRAQSKLTRQAWLVLLRREIDRVSQNPLGYLESHKCRLKIAGGVVQGPISGISLQNAVTPSGYLVNRPMRTLEPAGFPAA